MPRITNVRYVNAEQTLFEAVIDGKTYQTIDTQGPIYTLLKKYADDGGKVIPYEAPPERWLVPKSLIIERLHAAGKLTAASQIWNADVYARERWYAPDRPAVLSDDPEIINMLQTIGADPLTILAKP